MFGVKSCSSNTFELIVIVSENQDGGPGTSQDVSHHETTKSVGRTGQLRPCVGFGPLEGFVHKTSVASEILGGTVVALDEVLLGEGFELASGNEVSTLNSGGS